MTRFPLAVARCAVLAVLTLAGFGYVWLVVLAACVVVPFPLALAGQFRLAALGRRLARDWCGADVPEPDRTPPPAPSRREDGWYAHGDSVFKHPTVPAFLLKLDHYGKDRSINREMRWMLRMPFTAGLAVLLPPAAVVGGTAVAAEAVLAGPSWLPAWGAAPAVVAVVAGLLLAPAGLRAYGASMRARSQAPEPTPWWRRSRPGRWAGRAVHDGLSLGGLVGLSLAVLAAQMLNLLAFLLGAHGLLAYSAPATRPLTDLYRRYARRWTGTDLPPAYRPYPPPPAPGEDGTYRVGRELHRELASAVRSQRPRWVLRDPATWRDQLWAWGSLVLAVPTLLPAVVFCAGFFGPFWSTLWWPFWGLPYGLITGQWISPFVQWSGIAGLWPAAGSIPGWLSPAVGLAVAALGLALVAPMLRLRRWWDRTLLTPTASTVLASRVAHLTVTRADAADVQAAELRRIERDLHDGAQARLIAVGLGLGAVARLMETDPERARQVLAQAQETSAAALNELRALVRGIHPPVLAERGLGDAVRAVALDTPLPVRVDVDLPGRFEAPVESAAYFAVCEALANAARVATRVSITMSHHDGVLRTVVTDDGPGGADPAKGTGLRGIGRRLGTFDGTVTVNSPSGGPTVVTMEIPCASSSPKTSTS